MAFGKIGDKFQHLFDIDDDADADYPDEQTATDNQQTQSTQQSYTRPAAPQQSAGQADFHANNVVSMSKPAKQGAKIEIYEPRIYSDAKEVGRNLLENTAVLVNFTHLESDDARRIVDFLTGVVFAINGEIKRVGDRIFLVTPANFQVSGALASKLQDDLDIDAIN
ncbi:cell division protein SepF [Lacticaseibacillus pabuli]|uniref:Cell division protein SepF n=1 Tax=Lacticaseibacillus pabuli TaxID=3025672 RepID=A0ABY7WQM4_9LACO|nr:cell division protein SepF [Lacticaseibacillus sp. KACC 23028]WDF81668.1 cell division protein SepF [Lacticaseibacillus sp. KACC 23028]